MVHWYKNAGERQKFRNGLQSFSAKFFAENSLAAECRRILCKSKRKFQKEEYVTPTVGISRYTQLSPTSITTQHENSRKTSTFPSEKKICISPKKRHQSKSIQLIRRALIPQAPKSRRALSQESSLSLLSSAHTRPLSRRKHIAAVREIQPR